MGRIFAGFPGPLERFIAVFSPVIHLAFGLGCGFLGRRYAKAPHTDGLAGL